MRRRLASTEDALPPHHVEDEPGSLCRAPTVLVAGPHLEAAAAVRQGQGSAVRSRATADTAGRVAVGHEVRSGYRVTRAAERGDASGAQRSRGPSGGAPVTFERWLRPGSRARSLPSRQRYRVGAGTGMGERRTGRTSGAGTGVLGQTPGVPRRHVASRQLPRGGMNRPARPGDPSPATGTSAPAGAATGPSAGALRGCGASPKSQRTRAIRLTPTS